MWSLLVGGHVYALELVLVDLVQQLLVWAGCQSRDQELQLLHNENTKSSQQYEVLFGLKYNHSLCVLSPVKLPLHTHT